MMKPWAACAGAIPVALCLAHSVAHAQIRTETRVVLVDTIVTNKQGEYVRDLAAKDFRVWEDNKEQTIKSVALEKGPAAGPSRQRYLVLFFSGIEAVDRIAARQAVAGFVDANAQENRLMAVVSYNGALRIAHNSTGDATRLNAAVNAALSADVASDAVDSGALDTIRALKNTAESWLPCGGKMIVFVNSGRCNRRSSERNSRIPLTPATSRMSPSSIDARPLSAEFTSAKSTTGSSLSPYGGRAARGGGGAPRAPQGPGGLTPTRRFGTPEPQSATPLQTGNWNLGRVRRCQCRRPAAGSPRWSEVRRILRSQLHMNCPRIQK